jgi:hypothetical protein
MTDRPLAKFEDGRLWLDVGGIYEKSSKFAVIMKREVMLSLRIPDANRKAQECQDALNQYQAANSGHVEEST